MREVDDLQGRIVSMGQAMGAEVPRPWRSRISARQYRYLYRELTSLPPSTSVLDWGCGHGGLSWWLKRRGFRVAALDLDPPLFEAAIDQLSGPAFRFELAPDPSTLPFRDGSFDLVLSIGVLEHVTETGGTEDASLAEVRRVLREAGTFICYHLPNRGSWIEFMARRSSTRHSHTNLYGTQDIVSLFTRAGFRIERIRRYGVLPRNESSRLPGANSNRVAGTFDALDHALEVLFPMLAQNFMVVATPAR